MVRSSLSNTEELKRLLTQQRSALVREIEAKLADAKTERIAPDTVSTTDGGDKALVEAASGLDLAFVRHDVAELRAVEAALARIAEGTFGDCPDCGNTIAAERLKAYPAASRCAACQTAYERRPGGISAARL
jgi:DnaK suppressor protein